MLESSTVVTQRLEREVEEFRSRLQAEETRGDKLLEQLEATESALAKSQSEVSDLIKRLAASVAENNKSAPASEFSEKTLPDAATILSKFRAKRKKSPVTLADIEAILQMIGEG
ncbi:hypothetical protein QUA13_29070 [Microcoleus sp. S28C3]|uniref:hypothetical protein n=1 Tax=Microcoleus sp. S28C3 TaxID=3055414 RepID=UPI002FD1C63E